MKKPYSLKIYPDPVLRKIAISVKDVTPSILSLIAGMTKIMVCKQGIGLAAPQVGKLHRVIIADTGDGLVSMINPMVMEGFGTDVLFEGCLSIPGVCVNVQRQKSVYVSYVDQQGSDRDHEFTGLMARVIQHEIDHLNGILIIDHGPAEMIPAREGKLS